LNNRAENSHQPTRQRERVMKRFKSRVQAQQFLSIHGCVDNHFRVPANSSASLGRELRTAAMSTWKELTQSAA
jgi:putative transposase